MVRGAIRACLACCAAPLLWTAEAAGLDGLERLAARQQAAATLTASFTWTVEPAAGGEARPPRQGRLAFAAPASYDIVVRDGEQGTVDRWCSDGRWRWEVTQLGPEDPPDVRGPLPAGDGDADSRLVVACLRLDLDRLRRDYALHGEAAADGGGLLRLTATGEGGGPPAIAIRLGAGGEPSRIEIPQADGSRWLLQVVDLQRDAAVDPAGFRIPR